ncbi:MAG: TatD family hydrolase [Methylobacterium frigidaeris]
MTGRLIDFHCHLDLYPDFERLVAECDREGVYTLAVTTTPAAWRRNRDLAATTRYVRAGLGLHPQLVEERWREIDVWERHLPEARYVGEVGLDASPRHYRSLDRQKDVFGRILKACASEGGKILSVHSVRAARQVLEMVEEHLPPSKGTVILHWFTGSVAEAARAAGLGCFFSVNSEMLATERGRKLVRSLPADRLLTETDGPFTAEGGQPRRPSDVERAVTRLAEALQVPIEECRVSLLVNLKALSSGSPTNAQVRSEGATAKLA